MADKKGKSRRVFTQEELEDIAYSIDYIGEPKKSVAERYNMYPSNLSALFKSKKYQTAKNLVKAKVEGGWNLYKDNI